MTQANGTTHVVARYFLTLFYHTQKNCRNENAAHKTLQILYLNLKFFNIQRIPPVNIAYTPANPFRGTQ